MSLKSPKFDALKGVFSILFRTNLNNIENGFECFLQKCRSKLTLV
jgi:hypothetical protein